MAWSGGIFHRIHRWVDDAAADILILAERMDAEFDNYKAGLQNCITRDNQTPPTANIAFGGFKITNLGSGVADTDAANIANVKSQILPVNWLDNSTFQIAQRNQTITGTGGGFVTDRWRVWRSGEASFTASVVAATGDNPSFVRLQRDAANNSTTPLTMGQSLGARNSAGIMAAAHSGANPSALGMTKLSNAVFRVYLRKGADFSGTKVIIKPVVSGTRHGVTTDNISAFTPASGYTNSGERAAADISSSVWTPVSDVYSFASASTNWVGAQIGVHIVVEFSGTAGAADYVDVAWTQLNLGTTSAGRLLPTEYARDLAQCQRFYQKFGGAANEFRIESYGAAGATYHTPVYFGTLMDKVPVGAVNGTWSVTNCAQPTLTAGTTDKMATLRTTVTALGTFNIASVDNTTTITFDAEN